MFSQEMGATAVWFMVLGAAILMAMFVIVVW